MEKLKKKKITQVDLRRSSASDHTFYVAGFDWVKTTTNNNHIYYNDEWNGEYED